MDPWAWSILAEWTADRIALPAGPLFCVIGEPTRGRAWSATAARAELRHLAIEAAVRRRFAPHQLRHAHAVECGGEDPRERQLRETYAFLLDRDAQSDMLRAVGE